MVQMTESTFLSSDGKHPIYYREYVPTGEPRGILQLAHGISEHIGRYDAFARAFCEKGYIVVGNDHLGHGRSVGEEGIFGWAGENGGWETMVGDIHALHKLVRSEHPGLPCYLFGHSMGSFLARAHIIRFRGSLDGVILCGTGQQNPRLLSGALDALRVLCRTRGSRTPATRIYEVFERRNNRGFPNARTSRDWLNRDADAVDAFINDPLRFATPTVGLLRDLVGGEIFIEKSRNLERMTKELPVYFISGDKDPIGENGKGIIRAYKAFLRAGMKDVTMKLYPDARHELWNEENREEVFQDVLAWMESKSGRIN